MHLLLSLRMRIFKRLLISLFLVQEYSTQTRPSMPLISLSCQSYLIWRPLRKENRLRCCIIISSSMLSDLMRLRTSLNFIKLGKRRSFLMMKCNIWDWFSEKILNACGQDSVSFKMCILSSSLISLKLRIQSSMIPWNISWKVLRLMGELSWRTIKPNLSIKWHASWNTSCSTREIRLTRYCNVCSTFLSDTM